MTVFKIIGLLISFCVPSLYGFLKAYIVAKRSQKLQKFVVAFCELSEYVRIENAEKKRLFSKCFDRELMGEDFCLNTEFLKAEDITLIEEFVNGFGAKDKNSEYERTKFYIGRLQTNTHNAQSDKEKLCKLYSTLGVLFGISLCIFLI